MHVFVERTPEKELAFSPDLHFTRLASAKPVE